MFLDGRGAAGGGVLILDMLFSARLLFILDLKFANSVENSVMYLK